MRQFMNGKRWGEEGGPDEDRVRPHVLWLPQDQSQVLDYFGRLREITSLYPEIITTIPDADLHMTIQQILPRTADGTRVDGAMLITAAAAVQQQLTGLQPIEIEIGPARASRAAGIVEIWPETGPEALYRRVRAGLTAAGLQLPPAAKHFWPHMSCGYGVQDTDTPHLAARSDLLASDLGKAIRPGIRTRATVSSVWLVWERQHPADARYTFDRVHQLHLGRA
ncbi:2'-5' RNA ligase family protein [Kitasatospora griseola]|uniref:2'-5' RNA ligase family protein n=1 Tax=Kitasatospora griseola TaxID=2064 RepID=UPI003856011D